MKRTGVVQRIRLSLQRVVPAAKVILFGSETRGDARPDSDIDLLILLQDKERITLNDRINWSNHSMTLNLRQAFR